MRVEADSRLFERAVIATQTCGRRDAGPTFCVDLRQNDAGGFNPSTQADGLIVPHKWLRKKNQESGPKAFHAVDKS